VTTCQGPLQCLERQVMIQRPAQLPAAHRACEHIVLTPLDWTEG
jgi:hypothetical protein